MKEYGLDPNVFVQKTLMVPTVFHVLLRDYGTVLVNSVYVNRTECGMEMTVFVKMPFSDLTVFLVSCQDYGTMRSICVSVNKTEYGMEMTVYVKMAFSDLTVLSVHWNSIGIKMIKLVFAYLPLSLMDNTVLVLNPSSYSMDNVSTVQLDFNGLIIDAKNATVLI